MERGEGIPGRKDKLSKSTNLEGASEKWAR